MRSPIKDKDKFWLIAPGANEIFSYVDETPEIAESPWGFDSGSMSDDLNSVWANFSCVSVSGWGNDKLLVAATMQTDGSWSLSHYVTRAT